MENNPVHKFQINGPRVIGTTPGRPFLFRIPIPRSDSTAFNAIDLPAGIILDEKTGILSGSLESAGIYPVQINVTDCNFTTQRILNIVGGDHKLALTPPMGWNSWNVWGSAISDQIVRDTADAFIASGLADHGFSYINIDDGWEGMRCDKSRIRGNQKFPDMKALAEYIHSYGLKLGIYSSPGIKTCAGYEGSLGHEQQDAESFAEWRIDYLKYDWCSYKARLPHIRWPHLDREDHLFFQYIFPREELKKPYQLMRKALDQVDRDIVYSISPKKLKGVNNVAHWGSEVGGNLWRTTSDISDNWISMSSKGFNQHFIVKKTGPGQWNDPDMLVVGQVGWGSNHHLTKLTPEEQKLHITLWAMLASPLLIGCDLTQLDPFTLQILTNDEVLAIDQDPLGIQATRKIKHGPLEIWTRPLWDGTIAITGFNRASVIKTIFIDLNELKIPVEGIIRDLWYHQDFGSAEPHIEIQIPSHGCCLLKIGEPKVLDLNLKENPIIQNCVGINEELII